MPTDLHVLKEVPLFTLLDEEEMAVLASQVEVKRFAARQRIYKVGDPSGQAYILVSGTVRVTIIDDDNQEVVVDEPTHGEFFGFASMLDQTPHQTSALAVDDVVCVEVDRKDIAVLIEQKPMAGMDLLSVIGKQYHSAHQLVRGRAMRNANEMIDEKATFGEHLADSVARFGGSWSFIIIFGAVLLIYTAVNTVLRNNAWDPYPFILLNLFLSMLAAIQAPVIMMSQNRQDSKDRLRSELDYEVNRKAEAEIQSLCQKLNLMHEKLDDLEDLVRKEDKK